MDASKDAAARDGIVTQIALSLAVNGRLVESDLTPLLERLAPLVHGDERALVTLLADCVESEDARSMRMRYRVFLDVFATLRRDLRDYGAELRTRPVSGSRPAGHARKGGGA